MCNNLASEGERPETVFSAPALDGWSHVDSRRSVTFRLKQQLMCHNLASEDERPKTVVSAPALDGWNHVDSRRSVAVGGPLSRSVLARYGKPGHPDLVCLHRSSNYSVVAMGKVICGAIP